MSDPKKNEVEVVSLESSDSEPEAPAAAPPPITPSPAPSTPVVQAAVTPPVTRNVTQKFKLSKELKKLSTSSFNMQFDPEKSNREKRKLSKKITESVKTGHDHRGFFHGTDINMCDCLSEFCSGCFFPCKKCKSQKCSFECRNNRTWVIESIENEADRVTIRNPILQAGK